MTPVTLTTRLLDKAAELRSRVTGVPSGVPDALRCYAAEVRFDQSAAIAHTRTLASLLGRNGYVQLADEIRALTEDK